MLLLLLLLCGLKLGECCVAHREKLIRRGELRLHEQQQLRHRDLATQELDPREMIGDASMELQSLHLLQRKGSIGPVNDTPGGDVDWRHVGTRREMERGNLEAEHFFEDEAHDVVAAAGEIHKTLEAIPLSGWGHRRGLSRPPRTMHAMHRRARRR